eukprot:scaffold6381_cov99-Cylindrotheca_fusiformis.AAC.1
MSNREETSQLSAMVAWVESKLKKRGHDVQTIENAKSVLGMIEFEQYGGLEGLVALLKTVGRHEEANANVVSLAIELEESMKDFLALDAVESSGFYRDARLPRSLLEDEENDLDQYIKAAEASGESARSHLDFLKERQLTPPKRSHGINTYVCIIASSGTGKTQLAATSSLTYPDVTTIYLNFGGVDTTQPFYLPHVSSLGFLAFIEETKKFVVDVGGDAAFNVTANRIKSWAKNEDKGTSRYVRLLYHLLTEEPFRREYLNHQLTLRDVKNALKETGKPFLVFFDEVPPKDHPPPTVSFSAVLCLRDTLRYLGIAPILMSTHTGAQDYVGRTSRETLDIWVWVKASLPKYAPLPEINSPFLLETERPLVLGLVRDDIESGDGLRSIVNTVQEEMQQRKTAAWTTSPDLQLVQLFETDVEIRGEWFASAHNLVGHHFGCLIQAGELDGLKSYNCTEASLFEQRLEVAPVCAAAEPLLYLALVTWNEEMLHKDSKSMFPLVDSNGKPLTVRGAFRRCKDSFKCKVSIENAKASQNDGNLLEVLVHASMTLASMKTGLPSNRMYLGGMSLGDFLPLTRKLMLEDYIYELPSFPVLFHELNFDWPAVPALGSSNSGLPSTFSHLPEMLIGFLERPENKAMVDGRVYNVVSGNSTASPFISVDCKNYRNGVSSTDLKEIFKRIKGGIKCSLVFVSAVQANVFQNQELEAVQQESFKAHEKDSVSVVVWEKEKEEPVYLEVGGKKMKKFKAKGETSLLVVIIAVGSIEAQVCRKRKQTHPPCANL